MPYLISPLCHSCHLCHSTPFRVISFHVILCHFMLFHIILRFRAVPYRAIPCCLVTCLFKVLVIFVIVIAYFSARLGHFCHCHCVLFSTPWSFLSLSFLVRFVIVIACFSARLVRFVTVIVGEHVLVRFVIIILSQICHCHCVLFSTPCQICHRRQICHRHCRRARLGQVQFVIVIGCFSARLARFVTAIVIASSCLVIATVCHCMPHLPCSCHHRHLPLSSSM